VRLDRSHFTLSLVTTPREKLILNVSCGRKKPVYTAGRRNRPPSVCRTSFRLIIYECIKDSTTVGKAKIKTNVITEDNRAQKLLWPEYGNCAVCMSSSPPTPQMLNLYRDCLYALTVMYWEGHFVKLQQNTIKYSKEHYFATVAHKLCLTDNN